MIRSGVDPVEQRKAACADLIAAQKRGLRFPGAVDLFEPVKTAELSGGKYRDQLRNSLDSCAIPILGKMLVHDIHLQDILVVLEPFWHTKAVTADKLRRKLAEVLDYSTVKAFEPAPIPPVGRATSRWSLPLWRAPPLEITTGAATKGFAAVLGGTFHSGRNGSPGFEISVTDCYASRRCTVHDVERG